MQALPPELLAHVLRRLPLRDGCLARQVCTDFRSVHKRHQTIEVQSAQALLDACATAPPRTTLLLTSSEAYHVGAEALIIDRPLCLRAPGDRVATIVGNARMVEVRADDICEGGDVVGLVSLVLRRELGCCWGEAFRRSTRSSQPVVLVDKDSHVCVHACSVFMVCLCCSAEQNNAYASKLRDLGPSCDRPTGVFVLGSVRAIRSIFSRCGVGVAVDGFGFLEGFQCSFICSNGIANVAVESAYASLKLKECVIANGGYCGVCTRVRYQQSSVSRATTEEDLERLLLEKCMLSDNTVCSLHVMSRMHVCIRDCRFRNNGTPHRHSEAPALRAESMQDRPVSLLLSSQR